MNLKSKLDTFKKLLNEKSFDNLIKYIIADLTHPFADKEGVKVMEKGWDYLVILDACRYDSFKEIYTEYLPEGNLRKVKSLGSSTPEWLRKNFTEKYEDTVYISGNPYVSKSSNIEFDPNKHFYHVEDVWDYGWNEEKETVMPEEMNKAVIEADEKYPDKRKIIHYMQPHEPYIGEIQPNETWENMEETKKAYEESLRITLKEVNKLISKLEGKIVITADHGELFGKIMKRHSQRLRKKELIEVPWLIIDKSEGIRRRVGLTLS